MLEYILKDACYVTKHHKRGYSRVSEYGRSGGPQEARKPHKHQSYVSSFIRHLKHVYKVASIPSHDVPLFKLVEQHSNRKQPDGLQEVQALSGKQSLDPLIFLLN